MYRVFPVEGGDIRFAGVVTKGDFQSGYFQGRGYVGNPLKETIINPINRIENGTYDLTLDGIVVSFSLKHGKWSMINA